MAKKTTTAKKAKTAMAAPKAASLEVRKDGQGRFWGVPKGGGEEQGPFDSRKAALEAKRALTGGAPAAKPAKKAAAKKAKAPKEKRLSAIDAAAQVLAKAKEPMNAKEMIEALEKQGLWTSPGGKTPHATLYSAIIREIAYRGGERGHWGVGSPCVRPSAFGRGSASSPGATFPTWPPWTPARGRLSRGWRPWPTAIPGRHVGDVGEHGATRFGQSLPGRWQSHGPRQAR